jgi:hypothetical protein
VTENRTEVYVTKGTRVRAEWFEPIPRASLAGAQMKVAATRRVVEGVVIRVRGDHPTHPTVVEFSVRQEDGVEVIVRQEWIVAVLEPES